ncbi:hypothetical protein MAPG_11535 [Magnaporthiopsis poae ATCC 64411]|uniref:Uncharacterized protein n=1 Tax=Magnaporthiopsis poae (strain ATCC 64411 / 73-15) TaxID=644358 RepID=A0A0C4EFI5_MAGP6|nr:hypothetical protein MAPG_11535 [Magnaporthiopsis poae ATCC 64411]
MVLAGTPSFQDWYGTYGAIFAELSRDACNKTLASYVANPSDTLICNAHVNCILGATQEVTKAHIASAAIFLGMVPTFLSLIGPSITQLVLLSARRPLLALLLSSGSTTFLLDRLFRAETPRETLTRAGTVRLTPRLTRPWTALISAAEYLLVLGAAINVLHNSWQLGTSAIIVWKCELNFMPLIWVLACPFVFLVVAIPLQFTAIAGYLRAYTPELGSDSDSDAPQSDKGGFISREITPAIRYSTLQRGKLPGLETWAAILLNVGFCLAALQVLIGVGILSSVLFVSVTDAVWVAVRYLVSTGICRFVVMLELPRITAKTSAGNGQITIEH